MRRCPVVAAVALALAASGEAPALPLEVIVSGCASVRADATCEAPESSSLSLFIRTSPLATVIVEAGAEGRTFAPDGSADRSVTVTVPNAARSVVVRAQGADASAVYRRRIDIQAQAPCDRGRRDVATIAALEAKLAAPNSLERATALRCLARIERGLGKIEAALAHLASAIEIEHTFGRTSEEVDDRQLSAYIQLLSRRDFDAARAALGPVRALAVPYAEGAARAPYFEALVARETGDVRDAMALFDEAIERASRIHLEDLRADALAASTVALRSAGRYAEANARAQEALKRLPPHAHVCQIAEKLSDLGWGMLDTPEAQRSPSEDATAVIELSLTLAESAGCGSDFVANGLTNLAVAAGEHGLWDDALSLVEQARRTNPEADARVAYAWPQLQAEALLARGRAGEALARYDDLAAMAKARVLPWAEIDAAIGRGRALEALDRLADADRALTVAEEGVDRAMRAIPLGGGRDTFASRHERVVVLHTDVLLRRAFEEGPDHSRKRGPWTGEVLDGPHVERAARIAVHGVGRELAILQSAARIATLPAASRAAMERALGEYLTERDRIDRLVMRARLLPLDQRATADREIAESEALLRVKLDRALDLFARDPSEEIAWIHPREDEVILVFHPIVSGWVGFAITTDGAQARRIGEHIDAEELAESARDPAIAARASMELLEPFRASIAHASRLSVIAYGPLARVPFHGLPWDGAPLLERVAVVVGAGLPTKEAWESQTLRPGSYSSPVAPARPLGDAAPTLRALVVAEELFPGAIREIDAAAAGLVRAGFVVERLQGDDASAPAVRAALSSPDLVLVHLAGHAAHGGIDGLESAITLARGSSITAGDVLALPRVPPFIVLSACDSSTVSTEARAAGLGLAQAFLVAGARSVIASDAAVDDEQAARLLGRLYDGGAFHAEDPDLVAALRDAQRAQIGALGGASEPALRPAWRSYRVLSP